MRRVASFVLLGACLASACGRFGESEPQAGQTSEPGDAGPGGLADASNLDADHVSDAPRPDAAVDASLGSCPHLLLSDDFEGRTDPKGPWTSVTSIGSGTLVIEVTTAGSVLHASVPPSSGNARGVHEELTGIVDQKLCVAFAFMTPATTAIVASGGFTNILEMDLGNASNPETGYVTIGINPDEWFFGYNTPDTITPGIHPAPSSNAWHTALVEIDGAAKRLRISIDGVVVAEPNDFVPGGVVTNATFGLKAATHGTNGSFDVYIDHVVVATN